MERAVSARAAVGGRLTASWKSHWIRRFEQDSLTTALSQREKGNILRIVQSWDTGIKVAAHNDPSTCATFVQTQEGYYLADMQVMREEYPALKRAIVQAAERCQSDAILIEDKASGQSLLQDLRRETALPLIGIHPAADKVTRLAAVSALVEAGRVFLPKQAPWLAAFEAELLAFPNVAHDDQVDAFTQFLQWAKAAPVGKMGMRAL